jgi:RNA polymerase sigma-70 factor (ECF subfamily)
MWFPLEKQSLVKDEFESVRKQFGPLVWSIAMRITNQHADAVDCFQNVFLELISERGQSRVHDWGAYLRWLTTRRAIDLVRNRRRQESRHAPSDPKTLIDPAVDQQKAEFDELVAVVRSELENLPPSQAHAFWLVCVEQCSQAEVAELMEIERNHVGVLVHRARLHLRGRLNHLAPKKHAN